MKIEHTEAIIQQNANIPSAYPLLILHNGPPMRAKKKPAN